MNVIQNPPNTPWQRKFIGLDIHHPDLQTACTEAEHFCNRWVTGSLDQSMLILIGQPGCGKTHVLKQVERFARGAVMLACKHRRGAEKPLPKKLPSILYWFWPTIADEFNREHDWPAAEGMDADLLLWDDLGAETDKFQKSINQACQVLSRREKKFTVITTNVVPDQWAERFDQRMADRLLRNSIIVDLSAVPSWVTVK